MFEPPAITKSAAAIRERISDESMFVIGSKYDLHDTTKLTLAIDSLVGSDEMFKNDETIDSAYSLSWAMMFYLAERNPQAFAEILNHTASRPPFVTYQRSDRIRDFQRIVGEDTYEFSRRVAWYLRSI